MATIAADHISDFMHSIIRDAVDDNILREYQLRTVLLSDDECLDIQPFSGF